MKNKSSTKNWVKILSDFENSGLSKKKFTQKIGISHHCLYYYMKKLRPDLISKENSNKIKPKFIPLKPSEKKSITLILQNGSKISFESVPNPKWLGEFIKSIGSCHDQHQIL